MFESCNDYVSGVNITYTERKYRAIQLFSSILERTGSGLLLRSTRESETRILPSRTTVCNTNPYLAATFSFLRTPRDTTANCSTSASSTGLPKFHVKLWKWKMNYLRRAFYCILPPKKLISELKDFTPKKVENVYSLKLNFSHSKSRIKNLWIFLFFF